MCNWKESKNAAPVTLSKQSVKKITLIRFLILVNYSNLMMMMMMIVIE